jgi:YD repeat-containing protein
VEKYSISYDPSREQATITDPLGSVRTESFTEILGTLKLTARTQPSGAGSAPATSVMTYDADGNLASRTDFNGNVTAFSFDRSRNLETRRIEASGTAQARTISTEWHRYFRLRTRVAEPLRTTLYAYDSAGNLISKIQQPTLDGTGAQGFAAAAAGAPRTWRNTYNEAGLILTATGPRTDAVDVTTYAYDAQFNLLAVTNAAGHVTTFANHDANGRVGRIVDANGLVTEFAYNERGWLVSKKVNAELTSYRYDGTGNLTEISLPDGSALTYSYDAAHRLVRITDGLGNAIVYTVDAMGNRISEQVRDPLGVLTRQTGRVFDGLNRLQMVTGAGL